MAALRVCAVTPALARILAASAPFSSARATSSRSTVTKNRSPSRRAFPRCRTGARWSAPDKAGPRPRLALLAVFRARLRLAASASRERPPALSIRPAARPSSSSRRTLRICSGVNCWWFSRIASDWALWMKPRARSVYFSRFIIFPSGPGPAPKRRTAGPKKRLAAGRRLRIRFREGSAKGEGATRRKRRSAIEERKRWGFQNQTLGAHAGTSRRTGGCR